MLYIVCCPHSTIENAVSQLSNLRFHLPTRKAFSNRCVLLSVMRSTDHTENVNEVAGYLTCDQALFFSRRCSQRKNERLIQLLVESSVKSPESGLFSDWSGNKRQHKAKS